MLEKVVYIVTVVFYGVQNQHLNSLYTVKIWTSYLKQFSICYKLNEGGLQAKYFSIRLTVELTCMSP
jgi:hypothetical protein